jgi:hypothetical protein
MSSCRRCLAFLLLLPALAFGQDRLSPSLLTPARSNAVGYAIGLDLITHALTRSCAVYGGDALSLTRSGRAAWQRRNGDWVALAHRYLEAVRAQISAIEGPEAGRRFYDERKAELQRESQAFLEGHFPKDADAFGTCRALASEIGAGDFDLGKHAEHAAVLRALMLELPPPAR